MVMSVLPLLVSTRSSGGILLTVSGQFMNSVAQPVMDVFIRQQGTDDSIASSVSTVISYRGNSA